MKKLKILLFLIAFLVPQLAHAQAARTICKSATPVLQTSGAYTSGYVAGGKLTFTNIMRPSVGSGFVTTAFITDKAKQAVDLELELFTSDPGTLTDNAAFAPASASVLQTIGTSILFGSSSRYAFSANSIHYLGSLSNSIMTTPPSGTLYGVVVDRGGYTAASASDMKVTVCVSQD